MACATERRDRRNLRREKNWPRPVTKAGGRHQKVSTARPARRSCMVAGHAAIRLVPWACRRGEQGRAAVGEVVGVLIRGVIVNRFACYSQLAGKVGLVLGLVLVVNQGAFAQRVTTRVGNVPTN